MWVSKHRELGKIQQGSKHQILFKYDGVVPEAFKITKMEASCGCTVPVFTRFNGMLTASFTAPNVPKHLLYKGEYTTTKKVNIYTSEGDVSLTFRATIVTKL
jgi:hypothetical protein